jgi:frataxin-like iron-binding protein CyaY
MQVAKVTIATENGDQIVLAPQQVEPWQNVWAASTTT